MVMRETDDKEFTSSNLGTAFWIDDHLHLFVVKILMFFERQIIN